MSESAYKKKLKTIVDEASSVKTLITIRNERIKLMNIKKTPRIISAWGLSGLFIEPTLHIMSLIRFKRTGFFSVAHAFHKAWASRIETAS